MFKTKTLVKIQISLEYGETFYEYYLLEARRDSERKKLLEKIKTFDMTLEDTGRSLFARCRATDCIACLHDYVRMQYVDHTNIKSNCGDILDLIHIGGSSSEFIDEFLASDFNKTKSVYLMELLNEEPSYESDSDEELFYEDASDEELTEWMKHFTIEKYKDLHKCAYLTKIVHGVSGVLLYYNIKVIPSDEKEMLLAWGNRHAPYKTKCVVRCVGNDKNKRPCVPHGYNA